MKGSLFMSNLFIFGNGFDIAHGFNTSYNHFKDWLCIKFGVTLSEEKETPRYQTNYKGLESYNLKHMAQFFYNLIYNVAGNDWNQFEAALPSLDWISHIRDTCVESMVCMGGFNERDILYAAEDMASELSTFAFILNDRLFKSWATEIDISKPNSISEEFINLVDNDHDYFLNFNYTDTLEAHYNIRNVCHIHGRSSTHDALIVGHSGQFQWPSDEEYDSEFYLSQTYSYISSICDSYRKDTTGIYQRHKSFFCNLNDVTDIFIHGFSFAEVDMYYIKKIAEVLDVSCIRVHLHSYKSEDWKYFKKNLTTCGFLDDKIIPFRLPDLKDAQS